MQSSAFSKNDSPNIPGGTQKNGPMEMFLNVVLAWFPSWILFILFPTRLFLGNIHDFDSDFLILIPYLAVSAIWLLVSILIARSQSVKREMVVSFFFYCALYIFLADALTPLPEGFINKLDTANMSQPVFAVVFDIALFIAFVLIAPRIPFARVKQLFSVCVIVFICSETGMFFFELTRKMDDPDQEKTEDVVNLPQETAQTGNIYHFIFDAFPGVGFHDLLKELDVVDEFSGFDFFEHNRSNYIFTFMSVPSFLTGKIYRGGDLCKWRYDYREHGVGGLLHQRGYQLSYYGFKGFNHKMASPVVTEFDVELSLNPLHMMQLGDLWTLHVLPQFCHRMAYHDGKGIFSRVVERIVPGYQARLKTRWILVLDKLMEDERTRSTSGQYVYSHVLLPHYLYELDEICEPIYSAPDPVQNDIELRKIGNTNQSKCSIRKMVEMLDVLREEEKYKDSMIIIQSDHGPPFMEDDLMYGDRGNSTHTRQPGPRTTLEKHASWSRSLLLVKPFGREKEPFQVSDRLTQLADIPATIMEGLGEGSTFEEGISVFSDDFPEERIIPVFSGFKNINRCKSVFTNTSHKYSYSKENGLKYIGDEEISW